MAPFVRFFYRKTFTGQAQKKEKTARFMSFSCPIPVHLIHDEITKNRQTPHPVWDVLRPLSKGRHFVKKIGIPACKNARASVTYKDEMNLHAAAQ